MIRNLDKLENCIILFEVYSFLNICGEEGNFF